MNKIQEYISIFVSATEIQCARCGMPLNCQLCKLVGTDVSISCKDVVENSCKQAERFGGRYISFCPMGLVHFATPSMCGGGVLLISPDEFFEEEILAKHQLSSTDQKLVKEFIYNLPQIAPQRVSYLSELLDILTARYNKDNMVVKNQIKLKQQSALSEYIHEAKRAGREGPYPYNKESQLLMAISNGNKVIAQQLLNEILGHIFMSTGGKLDIVKSRILELVVLLSRSAISGGADDKNIFISSFDYLNKINNFDNPEELLYWLWEIMNECIDSVYNFGDIKNKDVIQKAVTYINSHYFEKVTLEQVSEAVYLSPTYFSKIFKEAMGTSFSYYLNSVRIDKAKALLLYEDIPLIEVASLVGFDDQSYFTKVFKKTTNTTPREFKEKANK